MVNASSDISIGLTGDFVDDLVLNGTVLATINHNYNITIYGDGALVAKTGTLHFNITNNGAGTIKFEDVEFANAGNAGTGGMQLQGGNWEFVNCTFKNLTRTAITFSGAANDAYFIDCTFSGNSSRALFLAGGLSSNIAEYNFKNCLFVNNSVSGYGGGVIYSWNSYTSIDIDGCAFTGNKAIGTGTTSGSDNRVDGGALYINASSNWGCSLNILNSYFENNFAQDDGGAIIVEGAKTSTRITSRIINCTFTGNTAAGASYWSTAGGLISAGITNGSGGAISYFGLTESSITNCTFYNNGITNVYRGPGTNCGNVGGGGAVGVDTDDSITDPSLLPPCPVLSNNIFVGNYVSRNVYETNTVMGINISSGFGVIPTPYTGNVFVMTGADADRQDPLVIARPITNNGNIGYDNGNTAFDRSGSGSALLGLTRYANDLGIDAESGLTVANIFINISGGVPVKEALGDPVGSEGNKGLRYYYMPSPTSDELYRDGSGPYFDSAFTSFDALGNPRDVFPNAGAIEIYWTKFNPGHDGAWSTVPTQIDNPADITDPYFVVKSLNFATNSMYYVATDNGLPSPEIVAMPRSALIPDDAQYGFVGWRSSQPDLGWWDLNWANANSVTETNLSDYLLAHSVSSLPADAFPLHQPGELVPSTKQTLTAVWRLNEYRVDFSLNYADPPAHPVAEDNYWLPNPSDITQGGYDSSGAGIVVPPYVGVPFGDHIKQPKADPVRAGYIFKGWYKDPGFLTAWDFASDTVGGDTVLYAQWVAGRPVVFHSTDGAFVSTGDTAEIMVEIGSLVPNPGTVPFLSAPVYGTHIIEGWYVGDEFGVDYATAHKWAFPADTVGIPDPPYDTIPYAALHLYAKWVAAAVGQEYRITATADDGSSIDPSGIVNAAGGSNKTFVFSAKAGYRITAVYVDGVAVSHQELASGAYTFYNIRSNHSINVVSMQGGGPIGDDPDDGGDQEGKESGSGDGEWAVLNLICAILTIFTGIIAIIGGRDRTRKEDDDGERSKTALSFRVLALILGIVSVIIFFLTEDWTVPNA
ncbi:MAG: InlB B-repeat-containing protein, partial [Methanomassiliicoccaceae archaeon]|nr:InlB B-repeat-containing protein [Methanomassiliicoccaceae archaeon]